jgi:hypothetical protein
MNENSSTHTDYFDINFNEQIKVTIKIELKKKR